MKRKNLIKLRVDLGLKSNEMAEKLNISRTKYSNLENGRVKPSIDLAYKIQEVFNVDDVMEILKEE